jgi:hypothetical protein
MIETILDRVARQTAPQISKLGLPKEVKEGHV